MRINWARVVQWLLERLIGLLGWIGAGLLQLLRNYLAWVVRGGILNCLLKFTASLAGLALLIAVVTGSEWSGVVFMAAAIPGALFGLLRVVLR